MAAPSNQDVIDTLFLIAPQFITDDPAKLNGYYLLLDQLRCMYNDSLWCCGGALALAQILAHYLSIASTPGIGTIASMTEGEQSISYAVSASDDFWSLSPYGKSFVAMRGMLISGPLIATGCIRIPGMLAWGPFYGTPFGPCC